MSARIYVFPKKNIENQPINHFLENFNYFETEENEFYGKIIGEIKDKYRIITLDEIFGVSILELSKAEFEKKELKNNDFYIFQEQIEMINDRLSVPITFRGINNFPVLGKATKSHYISIDTSIIWYIEHQKRGICSTMSIHTTCSDKEKIIQKIKYKPATSYIPKEGHFYHAERFSHLKPRKKLLDLI
jgi:hypothetical protein